MIGDPVNDRECLGKVADQAREFAQRNEVLELAAQFGTTGELAQYIRQLPQRNDSGDPSDGPRIACDVSQRLRLAPGDPNCVERSALYVAAAELLDDRPLRQLATIETPAGRHTFPLEDGAPVVLDPLAVTRNALGVGLYAIRQGSGQGHRVGELLELVADLAEEGAATWGDERRVRNGRQALEYARRGGDLQRNQISDVGFLLAMAEQAARAMSGHGVDAVRVGVLAADRLMSARNASRDHRRSPTQDRDHRVGRVRRRRKKRKFGLRIGGATISPDFGAIASVGNVAGRVGLRLLMGAARAKLASYGVTPAVLAATEAEFNREGRTLGSLAKPAPLNPLDAFLIARFAT